MAGRAGERAVGRQAVFVKQQFSERPLLFRKRIGDRKGDRGGAAESGFERRNVAVRAGRKCRDTARQRAEQKRRRDDAAQTGPPCRGRRPHINWPRESYMRDTSPSTAPASFTGVFGAMAAGQPLFSSENPARTDLTASAVFFSKAGATLSII